MAKTSVSKEPAFTDRVFVYNGSELEDPDSAMAEKDVKAYYQQLYPELTTASLDIKIEDRAGVKTQVVTFKKAAGTKG